MNATLTLRAREAGTSLLLRHCLSLGTAENRVPARIRLEEAIGPELARRLVVEPHRAQPQVARRRRTGQVAAGADEQEDQERADERDEQRRAFAISTATMPK